MAETRAQYDIAALFARTSADILCNTSYPLKPQYFSDYRSQTDIMQQTEALSFYFHIPFCRHLCKFCEYTRFLSRNAAEEEAYVRALIVQAQDYLQTHPVRQLYGLDIGGGTPTALHPAAFRQLTGFVRELLRTLPAVQPFESSMEFSFSTIDAEKLTLLSDAGIRRMSTGIQIYDKEILERNSREMYSVLQMKETLQQIHNAGIAKINLDIMYGFAGQTELTLHNTLHVIELLHPEQVTLYEMRYNQNALPHTDITRETLFAQYTALYEGLCALGYQAPFGRNTFTVCDDAGVSSYLHRRMLDGKPYKGFGIAAQSMSDKGISYNSLKSSKDRYLPAYDAITEEDVYLLPPEEIAAKFVSVSLYSGQFSLHALSTLLGTDAAAYYAAELAFLETRELLTRGDDGICHLTRSGFLYYGAAAALFWSAHHRRRYLEES